MCGIWGIINKKNYRMTQAQLHIMYNMATLGVLRGTDGTGVIAIDTLREARTLKIGDVPVYLFRDPAWKPFWEHLTKEGTTIIGHNRAATVGNATTENAHPFKANHITLVHNGSLRFKADLPKEYKVDSEWITNVIAEKGIEHMVEKIDTAFALVWWDNNTKTINIARNYERPLHYYEAHDAFYIMSEKEMLHYILNRQHIKAEMDHIKQFEANKLYTLDTKEDKLKTKELPVKKTFGGMVTPIGRTNYKNPPYTPPFKPFPITFTISEKEQHKKFAAYWGISENNHEISFHSQENFEPDNFTLYKGECISRSQGVFIIKGKTVEKVLKEESDKSNDKSVTLADGDVISKTGFDTMKALRCGFCMDTIDRDRPEQLVLAPDSQRLLCGKCASDYWSEPNTFNHLYREMYQ